MLPQLDQSGLHIFRPHDVSCHHGTFRLSICHLTQAQREKKAVTRGNRLVALLQLCESLTMTDQSFQHDRNVSSRTGAVPRSSLPRVRCTATDKVEILSVSKMSCAVQKAGQKWYSVCPASLTHMLLCFIKLC